MKKKIRKMTLSRETLRLLEDQELLQAEGGALTIDRTNCHCSFTACRAATSCC